MRSWLGTDGQRGATELMAEDMREEGEIRDWEDRVTWELSKSRGIFQPRGKMGTDDKELLEVCFFCY